MVGTVGLITLLSVGCTTKPIRPVNPDGTYCHSVGKWYRRRLTCTPTPVPAQSVELEAKQFVPAPDKFTVYVVRKRWSDAVNQVRLIVDNAAPVVTTPRSFVRLRLAPGVHKLTAVWDEGSSELVLTGIAGEMQFVELVGFAWSWGSTYRLEHGKAAESRARVASLRLVADVP